MITKCEIHKTLVDPSVTGIYVWRDGAEGSDWDLLFTFYSDEVTYLPDEFVGLTDEEAEALYFERDHEYFLTV